MLRIFLMLFLFATLSAQDKPDINSNPTNESSNQPNIIVIMADDVGWFNIGAYHRGMMANKTPNLDKLAEEGMLFTDYYAEASCTAGRANFITGQLPLRTGLTTVGQAGADVGMPSTSPTIATVMKTLGYATGQFGKNHLGDLNKFLPTVHGFDEFYGYLYHLDAMEDPFWHDYPPELIDKVGPRNMLHTFATTTSDSTVQPRWGMIGKQRIEDAGQLPPKRMETVDDEILEKMFAFMDKSKNANKPFFIWHNPSRMHVFTHLSDKYRKLMNPKTGYYVEEAGMSQLDDIVGSVMQKLEEMGIAKNTILIFTTDNGAEVFSWPDGGMTPFKGSKGMVTDGGFRVPAIIRWPGKVPEGKIQNELFSGLDWFPTLVSAAGGPKDLADRFKSPEGYLGFKVHLDGYDQNDLLTGKGPSKRRELFYFAEAKLGAIRIDDFKYTFINQPTGWMGVTNELDWPLITNLRLDPFERVATEAPPYFMDFYGHEFWRFVYVQDKVGLLAESFVQFPPQQEPASFNLSAIKQKVQNALRRAGQ